MNTAYAQPYRNACTDTHMTVPALAYTHTHTHIYIYIYIASATSLHKLLIKCMH